MAEDPEIAIIDAIYEALEAGEAEQALALGRGALHLPADDDPVIRFLCGVALVDLDRPDEAVAELSRAVELDPDDPEFRSELALAQFRCCRFDEALDSARRAQNMPGAPPDADYAAALVLERQGDYAEADRLFLAAATRDPDRFPLARRAGPDDFERQLSRAVQLLPAEFRSHLDRVAVIVEDLPSDALLSAEDPPLDPELLGLFTGVPLDRPDYFSPGGQLPAQIHLFKRNLERFATEPDELAEQVAVTLYHELGHYLGMDEDDLDRLDFS